MTCVKDAGDRWTSCMGEEVDKAAIEASTIGLAVAESAK
jgi:hypothetical protein